MNTISERPGGSNNLREEFVLLHMFPPDVRAIYEDMPLSEERGGAFVGWKNLHSAFLTCCKDAHGIPRRHVHPIAVG